MSDREVHDGTSSGSLGPPGPDVLLRTVVSPYRLGEVLLRIGELKLTGRLTLASDMGRRAILFHSGFPVFTQSSLFAERLGAIGVRHGFFGRQDVARALAHARERQHGLGESLLELGYVDPGRLHALLGVQLREVVAASCGGAAQRARFQSGGAPLRDVVILKLHPMTAALTALAGVPASEQAKLLEAVASRRLSSAPLPTLARTWLGDLGYLGDNELLLQGDPTVSAVRSRLLARYRAESERAFDSAQVGFAFAGTRVLVEPRTPGRIADLVTLTLLMSGAIKLAEADAAAARTPGRSEPLANAAESLQRALDEAVDHPLVEARTSSAPPHANAVDISIDRYLNAKRERMVALEAAVWGPSVESRDGSVPPELMKMYLTLKADKRPEVVLGVAAGAPAEQIMQAYARRAGMVASVPASASEHLQCRAAELSQRFDDALDVMLPGSGGRISLPPPPSVPPDARATSPGAEPASDSDRPLREPSQANLATGRPDNRASTRSEAIAAKVDALMRAGNWRGVLDTLESPPANAKPSFTLQLARAMAQRELEGRRRGSRWSWIVALLIGAAIGYLVRHFAGLPPLPF